MKRRIISIFFCLLILMGLAIPAYAEENPNTDPINGMIETNTIFTADEFVGELIKYENTIVCGLGIYEINEEGEINYIIGK